MGHVITQITLKNMSDIIKNISIREATVNAMVDTGATMLIINEELFNKLDLGVTGEREITFANGKKEICKISGPIEINWKDRSIIMPAMIVKDASVVLLGVMPLEGLDLVVDPVNQTLVGAHGDKIVYMAM